MSNIGLTEWECREIAEETELMSDPTYDREIIDKNPIWREAFILSEIYNNSAPLGWGRYITAAEILAKNRTVAMEPFHGLTPAQAERLYMLAEEASEVAQTCMKILRHGYSSYNPDSDKYASNGDQLENELLDLFVVYERMAAYGDLKRLDFYHTAKRWVKKLKWAHHQPEFHHPTLPPKPVEK